MRKLIEKSLVKNIIKEVYNTDYDSYFDEHFDDIKRETDNLFSFKDEEFYYFEMVDALYDNEDVKHNIGDSIKSCLLAYPCKKELSNEDYKTLKLVITAFFCKLYMQDYTIILTFNNENFINIDCRNGVILF